MPKTFANPQLTKNGELKHLLSIEGLSRDILTHVLDTAQQFVSVSDSDREVKKVPLLRGKSVFNLFFENLIFRSGIRDRGLRLEAGREHKDHGS